MRKGAHEWGTLEFLANPHLKSEMWGTHDGGSSLLWWLAVGVEDFFVVAYCVAVAAL